MTHPSLLRALLGHLNKQTIARVRKCGFFWASPALLVTAIKDALLISDRADLALRLDSAVQARFIKLAMSTFHQLLHYFPGRASSFAPCLPLPAKEPPAGPDWIHEIKHDGFRIMGRRNRRFVRLFSRNGRDLTFRFPLIASAVAALPVSTCLIDGEAIICDDSGLSIFDLIRDPRRGNTATLRAFDIVELKGDDIRNWPIEDRKAVLKMLLQQAPHPGIAYNRHFDVEGSIVFHHACKLGCEGIISKRFGSPYRSGRSDDWIKVKNPKAVRTHKG
jgi:bifunctional non-homologous end joining protein LigD